jgi:hypothetical protein
VVNLLLQAVADGANLIQQHGDAGLDKAMKFPFGNRLVHNSYNWIVVIEHYGQLDARAPINFSWLISRSMVLGSMTRPRASSEILKPRQ